MCINSTMQPDDPLSRTLSTWRVAPKRSANFRAAVWARIGSGARTLPWRAYARQHAAAVAGALALAVAAGAFFGHGSARARAAAESAQLASAYVQGLDARLIQMP
jgi:hypothetical protein